MLVFIGTKARGQRPSASCLACFVFAAIFAVGCNSTSPAPKSSSGGGAAASTTGTTTAGVTTGGTILETPLSIQRKDATTLSFPVGQPLAIQFQLLGDAGKDVIVALSQTPAGPTLVRDGENVTFNWLSPVAGTQVIRFLLRDRGKCQAAVATSANCEIAVSQYGAITAQPQYDVTSSDFTFVVGDGTTGSSGTTTTGINGTSALIQQILTLVGPSGGNGLATTLSQLTGGQLQQILTLVQSGGGGGGNIGQIISLVQGLGLTDPGGNGTVPAAQAAPVNTIQNH